MFSLLANTINNLQMFEDSEYRRKNTELTCLNQKNVDFTS